MTQNNPNASLAKIDHFVVLMFENRSFDHLLGYEMGLNKRIDGVDGTQSNLQFPGNSNSPSVNVARATGFSVPFDPGHEYDEVLTQVFAPGTNTDQPTMGGFLFSTLKAVQNFRDASRIMECFQEDQLPVFTTLAREFAVINYWHASIPGPTWPNRFFVHAGTSGGLTDSPGTAQIIAGFDFPNGTIYQRLNDAGKDWCIYHNGLPQSAGIDWLRPYYIDPFTEHFGDMDDFLEDAKGGKLPEYTFIEPCYDTGNNYVNGDSMHPMNDIRKGEALLKSVYEALRASATWESTMLIVAFDEHGGFYDHVAPPRSTPTGDDNRYKNPKFAFNFDLLGVRVPALVISPYVAAGTVIGSRQQGQADLVFDHTSVLKTIEERYGLSPLTLRDAAAQSLGVSLNLTSPRTDTPTSLPNPLSDAQANALRSTPTVISVSPEAPLSDNQQTLVDLTLRCNLDMAEGNEQDALRSEHAAVWTQNDAAAYLSKHQTLIQTRRENPQPPLSTSDTSKP